MFAVRSNVFLTKRGNINAMLTWDECILNSKNIIKAFEATTLQQYLPSLASLKIVRTF